MIRKNYITDRWAGFCPNCTSTDKEMIQEYEENGRSTIREYECNTCGEHWEVKYQNFSK